MTNIIYEITVSDDGRGSRLGPEQRRSLQSEIRQAGAERRQRCAYRGGGRRLGPGSRDRRHHSFRRGSQP